MIESLKSYVVTLITTIMMIIIIKMIAPEGKNKKYILFVCGTITTLIMLEPILDVMNLDINEVIAKNEISYKEYKTNNDLYKNAIKDSYEQSLINDITNRLKENGYNVSNVRVEYDEINYKPQKIFLNLENGDGYVQPVKIEVSNNVVNSIENKVENSKIQELIYSNYGIEKRNIYIERSK